MGSAWLQRQTDTVRRGAGDAGGAGGPASGRALTYICISLMAMTACLLQIGCAPSSGSAGSAGGAASAAASSGSGQGASAQDSSAADPSADQLEGMVAAVTPSGDSPSLSVKFRIEARPVVGMPVKVMLAIIPAADAQIDHIHGSFLPGSGLLLQSDRSFDIPHVQAGSPVFQEVTVVPQQTGVLSLDATLLVNADKSSQTRSYAIPLIASDNSST